MTTVDQLLELFWLQCWQISLLIILVWIANRTFVQRRPHLAYVLWLVVLVKCVTPPVISSPTGVFGWLQPPRYNLSMLDSDKLTTYPLLKTNNVVEKFTTMALSNSKTSAQSDLATDAVAASRQDSIQLTLTTWLGTFTKWWLTIWIGIAFLILATSLTRALICIARIRRTAAPPDNALANAFEIVKKQIGLRQPVRLLVTDSLFGPAVIGMFRPAVVMPKILIDHLSAEQSRAVIAHELTHIRRNDLALGLCQTVTQAIWWMNPFVWIANRKLTQQIERCCDEEVVARCEMTPAQYVRSLVKVLEYKSQLKPVVAFPGMRPTDLTFQRLEKIMNLRHGCQKQTPVRYWLAAIVIAIIALPGAANVIAIQEPTRKMVTLPLVSGGTVLVQPGEKVTQEELESDCVLSAAYSAGHLVKQIEDDYEIDTDLARRELQQRLNILLKPRKRGFPNQQTAGTSEPEIESEVRVLKWIPETNDLVALGTNAYLDSILHALTTLTRHGFKHYQIQTRVISCDEKTIEKLGLGEKDSNVRSIDQEQRDRLDAIVDSAAPLSRTTTLSAPILRISTGLNGQIFEGSERPFAAIDDMSNPIVDIVRDGNFINLRIVADHQQLLTLAINVGQSKIKSIDEEPPFQIPRIATTTIDTSCRIEPEKTILVVIGAVDDVSNAKQKLLYLFDVEELRTLPPLQVKTDNELDQPLDPPADWPIIDAPMRKSTMR